MVAIFSLLFSFFLFVSMSYFVASSEKWVEIDRFSGGSWYGGTRSFTIDSGEWRIRWTYEPNLVINENLPNYFHFQVVDVKDNAGCVVLGDRKTTGVFYFFRQGEFYLVINGLYVKNYSIVVEQNVD